MTDRKTAPETLGELRQELRRFVAGLRNYDSPGSIGEAHASVIADKLESRLLPPAPEPIKVGDRVRHVEGWSGSVVAMDDQSGAAWVRRHDCAPSIAPWPVSLRNLAADPSPSPEPEPHVFVGVNGHPDDDECTHRSDGTDATYCGLPEGAHGDSSPSPEPETRG